MKGTITNCLAEMVEKKFGEDKWAAVLSDAGLSADASNFRMSTFDIPEGHVGALLASTCKVLGVTGEQAADAFGEYWCCDYAPRVYKVIVSKFKSARDMILGMDEVHVVLTKTMADARPPRFTYDWQDEKTLIVGYESKRNMIDIYVGLARGVGKYFNEHLEVSKLSPTKAKIVFA